MTTCGASPAVSSTVRRHREILRAEMVIDCMMPGLNRYVGAQAVGGAADVVNLLPQVVQPGPANPRNVGLVAVDPGPAWEFGVAVGLGRLLPPTGSHIGNL
jgi:hypothetical protein